MDFESFKKLIESHAHDIQSNNPELDSNSATFISAISILSARLEAIERFLIPKDKQEEYH